MDFLVAKNKIFQNPEKLPLNELFLAVQDVKTERGITNPPVKCHREKYPALHKSFIDQQEFPLYQEYYKYAAENIEDNKKMVEIYLGKGIKFIESLNFLLQLNYHQFWCYMTVNPSTTFMLKSYLCSFTPAFEVGLMEESCAEIAVEIHKKVQLIFCRIFTLKHSEVEFMSQWTVLQLLEQSTLLSFPTVVNVCVAFGRTCPKLVEIVSKLYFHPGRRELWEAHIKKFLEYTLTLIEMLGGLICGFAPGAVKVPIPIPPKPAHFDPCWYEDVLSFFLETVITLNAVMQACVPMTRTATQMGIPYRLTYFYNEVFPVIYKLMGYKRQLGTDETVRQRVYKKVALARHGSVECFNTFAGNLINAVSLSTTREEREQYVEEYLNLITSALDDDLFIFDYHSANPINVQLELLTHFYPDLDPMQTKYILDCVECQPQLAKILQKKETCDRKSKKAKKMASPVPTTSSNAYPKEKPADAPPTEAEVNGKIEIIQDTFPDLGDAFILECLVYCNYDPVMAITLMLDDNLPPSLADMPRDAIRVPPEPEPAQPILAYRGKKPSEVALNLADRELKEIILKTVNLQMYDDDYDDREDSDPIMAPTVKESSESSAEEDDAPGKRAGGADRGSFGKAGGQGSGERGAGRSGFRPFCEDPAKLREQRELARQNSRGRGGGRDVVGKPKGQGQDETVVKNRGKKTVNKAARGNHNRKRGAQWKASRGMF